MHYNTDSLSTGRPLRAMQRQRILRLALDAAAVGGTMVASGHRIRTIMAEDAVATTWAGWMPVTAVPKGGSDYTHEDYYRTIPDQSR